MYPMAKILADATQNVLIRHRHLDSIALRVDTVGQWHEDSSLRHGKW